MCTSRQEDGRLTCTCNILVVVNLVSSRKSCRLEKIPAGPRALGKKIPGPTLTFLHLGPIRGGGVIAVFILNPILRTKQLKDQLLGFRLESWSVTGHKSHYAIGVTIGIENRAKQKR